MKEYKKIIEEIQNLNWKKFAPNEVAYLALVTAKEFAQSLRTALELYPENKSLELMALGEINTDNLTYDDYVYVGDHWEFLHHFCKRNSLTDLMSPKSIFLAGRVYLKYMNTLSPEHRAMTIFSREHELPGIFEKILESHDWEKKRLGFFKYYLERHIQLDSGEGGHGDLLENFELDEEVLLGFYTQRLKLYKSLITNF